MDPAGDRGTSHPGQETVLPGAQPLTVKVRWHRAQVIRTLGAAGGGCSLISTIKPHNRTPLQQKTGQFRSADALARIRQMSILRQGVPGSGGETRTSAPRFIADFVAKAPMTGRSL
jgi:hypothetical protein